MQRQFMLTWSGGPGSAVRYPYSLPPSLPPQAVFAVVPAVLLGHWGYTMATAPPSPPTPPPPPPPVPWTSDDGEWCRSKSMIHSRTRCDIYESTVTPLFV